MTNHPAAQLGIAMLTARLAGDREAFQTLTQDMPEGMANAILLRTAETMVKMIAQLTEQTPDEALKMIAAAIAAES